MHYSFVSSQIPAEAPDGKKDLDIIELADIRKEYTLALARLLLAKHYPDLKTTCE